MRKILPQFPLLALMITPLVNPLPVAAADPGAVTVSEELGCDFYQGRTNRIASVYDVTPTHVRLRYENGNLSRPIPRPELTGELARRYPYDAEKAAAFLAQKAAEDAQRIATQRAAYQAMIELP